jgi:hypothetical protein
MINQYNIHFYWGVLMKEYVFGLVGLVILMILLESCRESFGKVLESNPALQGKSGPVRKSMADRIAYRDIYAEDHWKSNQASRSNMKNWNW